MQYNWDVNKMPIKNGGRRKTKRYELIVSRLLDDMLYRIGIKNAGITESKIPSTLKNISMKKQNIK